MQDETIARTKHATTQNVGAVIVAAGSSLRMNGTDKMLTTIMGRPLITYSLQVFNDNPFVDSIVLVMSKQNIDEGKRIVEKGDWQKVKEVCTGGDVRQDSVRYGLNKICNTDWTVIHDGARPCIDSDTITMGLKTAKQEGSAIAAVPITDTIKAANKDLIVSETLSREGLWAVQTPQIFRTELLLQAHTAISKYVTDDASMVELQGLPVKIFMGSHTNIKVTTHEDIVLAESILKMKLSKN